MLVKENILNGKNVKVICSTTSSKNNIEFCTVKKIMEP